MEKQQMRDKRVRIGGAMGFWGEASHATAQLLTDPHLDMLVYDYLAEITLSILARARQKDPEMGYAADFITSAMAPNMPRIAERGVKVLSNAGGMNPTACADLLRAEIARQGLNLKVAVVTGDDLMGDMGSVANHPEMFSRADYPAQDKVLSVNAYLGATPILTALKAGADIVITGRCVDSALTLAGCMFALDWPAQDFDLLAAGSLAGHLIECGPQSTGGNFTDWQRVPDPANIGYPIAQVHTDGRILLDKPHDTGGLITPETVGEQMLYEIGDPGAYLLPDVSCDFTRVRLTQTDTTRVELTGARGRAPSGQLKVCTTFADGFRAGQVLNFNGRNAREKGQAYVDAVLTRTRARLAQMQAPEFDDVQIEVFGGATGPDGFEEIAITAAVRHQDSRAVGLFLKELIGNALATPPGLHFFTGAGRPKPSPVVKLFSNLVQATLPNVTVTLEGTPLPYTPPTYPKNPQTPQTAREPEAPQTDHPMTEVPLETLAVARSGDKGDKANIGVMARSPLLLPWIWAALTPERIAEVFADELNGAVDRFYLPGSHAMNILMHRALGGGGIASLRNDSQGKAFAQKLLCQPIAIPVTLVPNTQTGAA